MAPKTPPTLLVAQTSFAVQTVEQGDGTHVMRIVLAGSTISSDDPIVQGRENLFAPAGTSRGA